MTTIKHAWALHYVHDDAGDREPWKVCLGESMESMRRSSCHKTEADALEYLGRLFIKVAQEKRDVKAEAIAK